MATPRLEDSVRVASSFAGQQQADPWDAPYFGGPVFLAYAPTKLVDASSDLSPAVAPPSPAGPTDEKVPPASCETMSALDAASLNLRRAGHDSSLLDGLRASPPDTTRASRALVPLDDHDEELLVPLGLGRRDQSNN